LKPIHYFLELPTLCYNRYCKNHCLVWETSKIIQIKSWNKRSTKSWNTKESPDSFTEFHSLVTE